MPKKSQVHKSFRKLRKKNRATLRWFASKYRVSLRTLYRWKKRTTTPARGRPRKITAPVAATIHRIISRYPGYKPAEWGYNRWTASRIATVLLEEHGVRLAPRSINNYLLKKEATPRGYKAALRGKA